MENQVLGDKLPGPKSKKFDFLGKAKKYLQKWFGKSSKKPDAKSGFKVLTDVPESSAQSHLPPQPTQCELLVNDSQKKSVVNGSSCSGADSNGKSSASMMGKLRRSTASSDVSIDTSYWARRRFMNVTRRKTTKKESPPVINLATVWPILKRMIFYIEMVAIKTEGIYRKPGAMSEIQNLKKQLEDEITGKKNEPVDLNHQDHHVMASVLKAMLREKLEPLITFDRYEDCLQIADIIETEERTSSVMLLMSKLPPLNFEVLDQLFVHLVRVALHTESNQMTPHSLAIIFAPSLLRTDKKQQPQEMLLNVNKEIEVIETIINEYYSKAKDLDPA